MRKTVLALLASAGLGAALSAASVVSGPPVQWVSLIWSGLHRVYELVGITAIGLLPLILWTVRLILQQRTSAATGRQVVKELDFGYISRTATVLGLLGTIIALAAAGGHLAVSVADGSSAAVLQIIPAVGQALFSTITGLVIALVADTALHLGERKRLTTAPLNTTG